MSNTRRTFRIAALFFLLVMLIVAIDFSRRTTFPGRVNKEKTDSVQVDTMGVRRDKINEK